MSTILEVTKVSKKFGTLTANKNISFSVSKGEILAVLGENGAGKTTLMNVIFGHYIPDSGTITLKGVRMRCLLYTSPSPRDVEESRMPSSA